MANFPEHSVADELCSSKFHILKRIFMRKEKLYCMLFIVSRGGGGVGWAKRETQLHWHVSMMSLSTRRF